MDKKFFLTYNFLTIYLIYLQFFSCKTFKQFQHFKRISQNKTMHRKPHRQVKGGVGDTDKVIYLR